MPFSLVDACSGYIIVLCNIGTIKSCHTTGLYNPEDSTPKPDVIENAGVLR
jgi:hypothetical protein